MTESKESPPEITPQNALPLQLDNPSTPKPKSNADGIVPAPQSPLPRHPFYQDQTKYPGD